MYYCKLVIFCIRYSNLDFGWKKSIDSKAYILVASSCTDENECSCKHSTTVAPEDAAHRGAIDESSSIENLHQMSVNKTTKSLSPKKPFSADKVTKSTIPVNGVVCTESLTNGSAELLNQGCICHQNQINSYRHDLFVQPATSVPVHNTHRSENQPKPSFECNLQSNNRDGITNKSTSDCCSKEAVSCNSSEPLAIPQWILDSGDCPPEAYTTETLGPNPGLILQALTLSNASDGFNLERLEMLGDSFLKHAITTYLFCTYPDAHEGRLSYMRSKKVGVNISFS